MSSWETFAVISGGASAALLGLLFVGVSIQVDAIAEAIELRSRAAQTLSLFVCTLLAALVFALPGQASRVHGIEFFGVALVMGALLEVLERRARRQRAGQRIAHVLDVVNPDLLTISSLLIGGGLMAFGLAWAEYLVAFSAAAAITGGTYSAWLLLVRTRPETSEL